MLRKVHFHIYTQQLNVSKGVCIALLNILQDVNIPLSQNRVRPDLLTLIKGVNTVIRSFRALHHLIKCA